MSRLTALACLACFALATFDTASADSNWPRWRGPNQDGHSNETGFPRKWSPADIKWTTPLPGAGAIVSDHLGRTNVLDGRS